MTKTLECLMINWFSTKFRVKKKTTYWKLGLTLRAIQGRPSPRQTLKIDLDSSAPHWAGVNCVLSCGLRAKQPLSQAISLIKPLEEVLKGALLTAVCLLSYFLTHWHALDGSVLSFVKVPVSQWQVDRWCFKTTSGSLWALLYICSINIKGADTKLLTEKNLLIQRMKMCLQQCCNSTHSFWSYFWWQPSWKYRCWLDPQVKCHQYLGTTTYPTKCQNEPLHDIRPMHQTHKCHMQSLDL